MDLKCLISVIVPVYNVEKYLPRCVESILAQTHRELEIILVDDGTKDNAGVLCDEFAARDPRVKVIHKENGGLSSARNAGLEIARGEYIGFVDSDDWIEPDMYETLLALARRYGVKLVCCGRYDVKEATGEKKPGLCPAAEEAISGEELVRRIFTWKGIDSAAWDKLYHRSLLEELRYPLGRICEDVPVTYRIALKAGRAAMCDRPLYNYLHRAGSITKEKAVTEKNFHLSEHTAQVYDHIRQDYPGLVPEAAFLRVRSLRHLLLTLELAAPETRARFARQRREARRSLRSLAGFVLTCNAMDIRERVTDLLLMLGLYRLLRPLFHK